MLLYIIVIVVVNVVTVGATHDRCVTIIGLRHGERQQTDVVAERSAEKTQHIGMADVGHEADLLLERRELRVGHVLHLEELDGHRRAVQSSQSHLAEIAATQRRRIVLKRQIRIFQPISKIKQQ